MIELFLKENLIYESRHYHNIVFKGNDKNGVTRFASMRGVFDKQGKPFKCDVEGNDKNYGFNVVNVNSTELVVFEAAIDLMSYVDIFADYESNKLALGMLADVNMERVTGAENDSFHIGEHVIPISRSYNRNAHEKYDEYLRLQQEYDEEEED